MKLIKNLFLYFDEHKLTFEFLILSINSKLLLVRVATFKHIRNFHFKAT